MPLGKSRLDSAAEIGLIKDWAPGADSGFADRVCLFTNTDGPVEQLCLSIRGSLTAHRLVFHPFSERSPIQEELLREPSNAKQMLAEGFHRVVVLDVSRAVDRKGAFDLAAFYQYAFAEFVRAFGIAPSEAYHEEDMVQILRDEPTSLLCFLNAHLAPSRDRSRLRSLTQEKHHSLIVYRHTSDTTTGLGDGAEVPPPESHQLREGENTVVDVGPSTKSSESERVERAIRGDRDALKELLQEYGPTVGRRIAANIPKRFRSLLSQDDVMQETYVDALLSVERFNPRSGSFVGWLATIARRNLLDAIYGLDTRKRRAGMARFEPQPNVERDFRQSDEGDWTARQEAMAALSRVIRELPEACRRVVQMYDVEERSADEVAAALGRSQGAMFIIRKRAHRRLEELVSSLRRTCPEDERLDSLIAQAEERYEADPTNSAPINELADLLCRREQEAEETKAIRILFRAYDQSNEYRYKMRAHEIYMKQLRRKTRQLREARDPQIDQARATQLSVELAVYKERVEQYPTDLGFRFEYGKRLFEAQRYDEAIPILEEARNEPRIRFSCGLYIGRCFFEKGCHRQAANIFRDAIGAYEIPDDELCKELHYWLGRALQSDGNTTEALKTYGQLIEWDYNYRKGDVRKRIEELNQMGCGGPGA